MRERAESLRGSLTVATGAGQGTRLVVMIPFPKTSEFIKNPEVLRAMP